MNSDEAAGAERGALPSQPKTLYHATCRATAEAIVRDLVIPAKLDKDASLPGRAVHKVYLATSRDILSAIPHADTVVEVEVLHTASLSPGEGDDPSKGWREFVYQAPDADTGLLLTAARIV
jgi:hypothetical protein